MSSGTNSLSIETQRTTRMGKDAEGTFNKAIELAARGDFDEAISALHEVTKTDPSYAKAWAIKAMLYRLTGNPMMADLCTKTASALGTK